MKIDTLNFGCKFSLREGIERGTGVILHELTGKISFRKGRMDKPGNKVNSNLVSSQSSNMYHNYIKKMVRKYNSSINK